MRSADQFATSLVIVPSRRSAQANATVERISSGAASYVPMATVTNVVREMELLQSHGFWIYGADMNGEKLTNIKFPQRTAIVMGSEGSGLSQLVENGVTILSQSQQKDILILLMSLLLLVFCSMK